MSNMTTTTITSKTVNVKGDVVSQPKYSELKTRAVVEFRFRRYGLTYLAKIYSNQGANNTAFKKYLSLKEGSETVLYNAKYQEIPFTTKDDRKGVSYQIIANG